MIKSISLSPQIILITILMRIYIIAYYRPQPSNDIIIRWNRLYSTYIKILNGLSFKRLKLTEHKKTACSSTLFLFTLLNICIYNFLAIVTHAEGYFIKLVVRFNFRSSYTVLVETVLIALRSVLRKVSCRDHDSARRK